MWVGEPAGGSRVLDGPRAAPVGPSRPQGCGLLASGEMDYDDESPKDEELLEIIGRMHRAGINFLAVDFDKTLISEHTSGKWEGTVEELASKTRPFFRRLIPLALDNRILVAIVTLSPQVPVITEMIQLVFPSHAEYILIRGDDNAWSYQGKGSLKGKQRHMASAAEELANINRDSKCKISRATTLLVDDDLDNVRWALNSHTRAILCDPNNLRRMVEDLRELE